MLNSLRSIVLEVNAARDMKTALASIVTRVKQVMATQVCSVYLRNAKGEYVLMATDGLNPDAVGKVRLAAGEGLVGRVVVREEPINLEHAEAHPSYQYFPETGEERYASFLGAPIIHHRPAAVARIHTKIEQDHILGRTVRRRTDHRESAHHGQHGAGAEDRDGGTRREHRLAGAAAQAGPDGFVVSELTVIPAGGAKRTWEPRACAYRLHARVQFPSCGRDAQLYRHSPDRHHPSSVLPPTHRGNTVARRRGLPRLPPAKGAAMAHAQVSDQWERGTPYERYVGRWSRRVAPHFLAWLDIPIGRRWVDVRSPDINQYLKDHSGLPMVAGASTQGLSG